MGALRTLLMICVISAVITSAVGQIEKPPFTVTVTAAQPTVRLGDPIMIHIVLKSVSRGQFTLPEARHVGRGEMNYRITVEGSDGSPVPDTEVGRRLKNREATGSRSVLIKQLNYGDEVAEDADLNKVFKITDPGDYVVQVERSDGMYADSHIKSNKLVIHVKP